MRLREMAGEQAIAGCRRYGLVPTASHLRMRDGLAVVLALVRVWYVAELDRGNPHFDFLRALLVVAGLQSVVAM